MARQRMTETQDTLRKQKLRDLQDNLACDAPNPSHVWSCYTDVLNALEFESLPLEIHQQVLRRCVPPATTVREAMIRRMEAGRPPRRQHVYESRLKSIMRHIRMAGYQPDLDDYHFILEQFAAVGHHSGAL